MQHVQCEPTPDGRPQWIIVGTEQVIEQARAYAARFGRCDVTPIAGTTDSWLATRRPDEAALSEPPAERTR